MNKTDRESCINTIKSLRRLALNINGCIDVVDDQNCDKMIEILESEPHWILCSERMPEEREWIGTKRFGTTISDEVYVTFESPNGERFCKHIRFQNGKLNSADQHTIDTIYKGSKPIAWTPRPETYNGVAE